MAKNGEFSNSWNGMIENSLIIIIIIRLSFYGKVEIIMTQRIMKSI